MLRFLGARRQFSKVVAAINYGFFRTTSWDDIRELARGRELGTDEKTELFLKVRKLKCERPTDDNAIWVISLDKFGETKGNAVGDIGVSIFASNRGSLAAIMSTDGGARGDVFPF